ncbi:MAG: hypothetical protein H0V24_01630 [Chloroflexia bacterium]|nr:hypothetical protein [Chloroflexia bacterium]
MGNVDQIDKEQLLASAATYLIEGHDEDAARLLLACHIEDLSEQEAGSWDPPSLLVELRGPRMAYDALVDLSRQPPDAPGQRVQQAFQAVLPRGYGWRQLEIRAELVPIDPDWRTQLISRVQGTAVDNQGLIPKDFRLWNNLRFRSATEVKIAEALDRAGVLFFPLCRGRLNQRQVRVTREPDFLVCHQGRWGMIEVDGEPWHRGMAAEDHARDRLFKAHGVKVVEHFDAKHCYNIPDEVVKRFLAILTSNG